MMTSYMVRINSCSLEACFSVLPFLVEPELENGAYPVHLAAVYHYRKRPVGRVRYIEKGLPAHQPDDPFASAIIDPDLRGGVERDFRPVGKLKRSLLADPGPVTIADRKSVV